MNRVLLIAAIALAGAAIASPTVIGLSGNTSFTRDIRVPVPSGAHHVEPNDLVPSASPHDSSASRHEDRRGVEDHPGHDVAPSATTGDHGGLRTDDHGGLRTDDHGGLRTDDHGGLRTNNSGPGRGSSGTDDHSGGDDRSGRSGRSGGDG